jgi:hypothetical protein
VACGRDIAAMVVLVRGDAEVATWPLVGRGRPDLAVVDELARWRLGAQRLGCSIRLRDACVDLLELLELVGLREILTGATEPVDDSSRDASLPQPPGRARHCLRFEAGGEAERGEQAGVEEIVHPDDPIA